MEVPNGDDGTRKDLSMYHVKTEIFPREMGRKIGEAEVIRHASDYDDFYIASLEEAERLVSVADSFIQMVELYCNARLEREAAKPEK